MTMTTSEIKGATMIAPQEIKAINRNFGFALALDLRYVGAVMDAVNRDDRAAVAAFIAAMKKAQE